MERGLVGPIIQSVGSRCSASRPGSLLLLELACLLGPVFALLQLAQWIPQWILGACA
jgi:hypothetical protein